MMMRRCKNLFKQKITDKNPGVNLFSNIAILMLIFPLLAIGFTILTTQVARDKIEEAVLASNLSISFVDQKEVNEKRDGYQASNFIYCMEINGSTNIQNDIIKLYKDTLIENLQRQFKKENINSPEFLLQDIIVEDIIVYNVKLREDNSRDVDIYQYKNNNTTFRKLGDNEEISILDVHKLGRYRPLLRADIENNGNISSSIYSRISFKYDNLSPLFSEDSRANVSMITNIAQLNKNMWDTNP